jgi:hypothetical protein
MYNPPPSICSSVTPGKIKLNFDPPICPLTDLNVIARKYGRIAIVDSDAKHSSVNFTINRIRRNLSIANFSDEEINTVITRLYNVIICNLVIRNEQQKATTIQINQKTILDTWKYVRKYSLNIKYNNVQPPHLFETLLACPQRLQEQEEDNLDRTRSIWAEIEKPALSIQIRARMDFLAHKNILQKYLTENSLNINVNPESAYWRLCTTADQRFTGFFNQHFL